MKGTADGQDLTVVLKGLKTDGPICPIHVYICPFCWNS